MSHIVKHLKIDVVVNFKHSVGSLSDGAGAGGSHFYRLWTGAGAARSHFSTFWNCRKIQNLPSTGRAGKIGPRLRRGAGAPEALPDSLGTSAPGLPGNRGSSRAFVKRITKKEGFNLR